MVPSTQKALLVTAIGNPVELVNKHPVPEPGPDQVLLKVDVAGLNPHDEKARGRGLFIAQNLPAILTNDVSGTVVKLGPGVTKYKIGDRIISHAGFGGGTWSENGLQEYAIHVIGAGVKIPDNVTSEAAATLPTNIIAPLFGLFADKGGLGIPAPWSDEAKSFDYKSTTILIVGGGSSCGKFGVQLAKLAGIGKIVVVGGPVDELKSYGATHIIDRHGGYDVVLARIRDVVGDNLEYAFDAINQPEGQILTLNALSSSKKGKFARLLPTGPIDESKVVGKQAGFELINVFGSSQVNPQLAYPFWERIPDYLASGKIKLLHFVTKKGLSAENVNSVLDGYKDGANVVKTHIIL